MLHLTNGVGLVDAHPVAIQLPTAFKVHGRTIGDRIQFLIAYCILSYYRAVFTNTYLEIYETLTWNMYGYGALQCYR